MVESRFKRPAFSNLRKMPEDHVIKIPPDKLAEIGIAVFRGLPCQRADADGPETKMQSQPAGPLDTGVIAFILILFQQPGLDRGRRKGFAGSLEILRNKGRRC